MQNKLPPFAKILFISDVHLGGFSKEKDEQIETELIKLVDYAEKHKFRIAILGDLFDYWMEYENYVPNIGKTLLQRFADFNKKRNTVYITGNHDNWTNGYFNKLGFDVEEDYRLITIDSNKVLLLHGDATGSDLKKLNRPLLHRIMRNKSFVRLYKTILAQPQRGIRVMKYYSRFTNFLSSTNPGPLDRWSKKMLQGKGIDVIICGHDHVPRYHNSEFGTYLNTGTFYDHKTLVAYNNRQFSLVCWNSREQKLTLYNNKTEE